MEKEIKEILFGAKDSEMYKFEYPIPKGYEAEIKNGKVIVTKKDSEDERIRKGLLEIFNKAQFGEWGKLKIKDIIAWLEKLKDKVVEFDHDREQQPAKEDGPFDEDKFLEGELADFLQNYDKEYDDDAAISDVAIHFYELGKKMKQKPAEWSEEDENIRQSLINDLENAETEDEDVQKELNEKVAWLKSLRPQPHWKPSEAQLDALLASYTKDEGVYDYYALESLYNDLKKLR